MAKQSPSAAKKLLQGVIVLLIIAVLLTVINERPDEPQAVEIPQETATAPAPTPTRPPTVPPPTPTQPPTDLPPTDADIMPITLDSGRGFIGDWWRVYFNHPPGDPSGSGLDAPLVEAIAAVRHTLDIAAFEMNHERIAAAILDAHQRGVRVRIVTDDQHGLDDEMHRRSASGGFRRPLTPEATHPRADKHVDSPGAGSSDAGSTPAASTTHPLQPGAAWPPFLMRRAHPPGREAPNRVVTPTSRAATADRPSRWSEVVPLFRTTGSRCIPEP